MATVTTWQPIEQGSFSEISVENYTEISMFVSEDFGVWGDTLPSDVRLCRATEREVVSVPKDAADAMDRVLNRLAGMFGDDAGNMPDQLHDDYLTVRTWLDALPAGWKGVGDGS